MSFVDRRTHEHWAKAPSSGRIFDATFAKPLATASTVDSSCRIAPPRLLCRLSAAWLSLFSHYRICFDPPKSPLRLPPYLSSMGCAQSKKEDVVATNQPGAEAPASPVVTEEPKVEEPQTEEAAPAAEEPVAVAEPEAEEPAQPSRELYKITGHEIDDAGVVFYTVEAVEGNVAFKKRFSEFKALVVVLGSPRNLPALPASGLGAKLRGKHNPQLIEEREKQLAVVLNAIANDAELAEKEPFKKFVE